MTNFCIEWLELPPRPPPPSKLQLVLTLIIFKRSLNLPVIQLLTQSLNQVTLSVNSVLVHLRIVIYI